MHIYSSRIPVVCNPTLLFSCQTNVKPAFRNLSKVRGLGRVGSKLVFESGFSLAIGALVNTEEANLFYL